MSHNKILLNLKELAETTVALAEHILNRIQADLVDDILQQQVDLLIDGIVAMNQSLQIVLAQDPDAVLQELFDEVAGHLVSIIAGFELEDPERIRETYLGAFMPRFPKLVQVLNHYIETRIKTQVVVIGVNEWSIDMGRLLDSEKAEIVAFVSDKPEYQGKSYHGVPILASLESSDIEYDFVILAEESSFTNDEKPVLDLISILDAHYDFETYRAMTYLSEADSQVEAFISGLSYAEVGIDAKDLPYKTLNLGVSSQDLFYDYEVAKLLLSKKEVRENVKLAIIGLSYYSFEFDLSRSRLKDKTLNYYPFFKNLHHHEPDRDVLERFDKFEEFAQMIFHKDYLLTIYQVLRFFDEGHWNRLVGRIMGEVQIGYAQKFIDADCNKDYPLTVEENVQILKEYVEFLLEQNIRVAFVVCPTSKHYHPFFSTRIKEQFLSIMEQFKNEYPTLQLFDYFDSADFEDEDFYDVSHLNIYGAKKLTAQLKQDVVQMMQVQTV